MTTPPIKQECIDGCCENEGKKSNSCNHSCHKGQECCCPKCAYPFAKEQDVDTSSAACQVCPCHKGQGNTADRHRMAHILRPPVDAHKRMGELHDEIEGKESEPEVFMVGGVAEVVRDLDWEPLKSAVTDEDLDAAIKLLPKSESWEEDFDNEFKWLLKPRHTDEQWAAYKAFIRAQKEQAHKEATQHGIDMYNLGRSHGAEAGKREGLKTALEIFKNKIFHRGTPTEVVEAIEMALLNLTPHHDKS